MVVLAGSTAIYTVAERLRVAVTSALTNIQRSCVVNGAVAWDECECGAVYVGLLRQYLSESFPGPVQDTNAGCNGGFLAAELTITVARCAPSPPDGALSPSCAALDASAQEVLADAWTVMDVVPCTLEAMKDALEIAEYLPGQQPFRGPLGGCVASELSVLVAIHRGVFT